MASPKPKARNVAKLKNTILQPSLTSTYECSFVVPPDVKGEINSRDGYNNALSEKLTLSCREAALPGTSLATHTLDNDRTGVTERHAYRRQYDTTSSFSFYVDHDYDIINFFENYISFIVNEPRNTSVNNDNYFYRVSFPNDYKTNFYIKKFERDYAGKNLTYKFFNAYPISINQMPVNYDASQILLCTVNFNFSRYVIIPSTGLSQTVQQSSAPLPIAQRSSSVINDAVPISTDPISAVPFDSSFGGTAGSNTDFVERDTATGARMDGGDDGPLLLPDGSPVRDADGNLREMF